MSSPEELGELLRDGARFGDLDDVKEALSQGADVDAADDGGKTGEMNSGVREKSKAAADVSFSPLENSCLSHTTSPRAALHMAAANGHADVIRFLLSKSADPSPKTREGGNTPLHWACLNGRGEATKALLEGGASPSALNSVERTPVDEALGGEHQDAILGVMREFAARGAGRARDGKGEEEEGAAAEAEVAAEGEDADGGEMEEDKP